MIIVIDTENSAGQNSTFLHDQNKLGVEGKVLQLNEGNMTDS